MPWLHSSHSLDHCKSVVQAAGIRTPMSCRVLMSRRQKPASRELGHSQVLQPLLFMARKTCNLSHTSHTFRYRTKAVGQVSYCARVTSCRQMSWKGFQELCALRSREEGPSPGNGVSHLLRLGQQELHQAPGKLSCSTLHVSHSCIAVHVQTTFKSLLTVAPINNWPAQMHDRCLL